MKFNKKTNVRRIINRPAISPQTGGGWKVRLGQWISWGLPLPHLFNDRGQLLEFSGGQIQRLKWRSRFCIKSAFWKAQRCRTQNEEWKLTKDTPLEQMESQHFYPSRASWYPNSGLHLTKIRADIRGETPLQTPLLRPITPDHFWQTFVSHFLSKALCLLGKRQETREPPTANVDTKEMS